MSCESEKIAKKKKELCTVCGCGVNPIQEAALGRVCQQGDQELEDGQELQLRKMWKGGSNRSLELGWFLRSRTGRIQTGAVIGTGRRVKQACTFPVCITSLPSEGLGKASLPAQAVGTLSSSVRENNTGTGPSAPTAEAETPARGAQCGHGRGPALPAGGRGASALLHWG